MATELLKGVFDRGSIEFVHASPAKGGDNTIVVDPRPCPEDWCEDPYGCEPEPDCNDPDGCDPYVPPECVEDIDCPTDEFCNEEGTCLPLIK